MDLYEKKQLRYKYIFISVMISCIVAIVTSSVTYMYCSRGSGENFFSFIGKRNTTADASSDETISAISESLKSFRSVIDNYYIGDIDETKLLDGAIKGYVKGLEDEYSEYMT